MNWATIQEAVRLAVATATGLADREVNPGYPIRRVEWQNRSSAQRMVSGAWVDLILRQTVGRGIDEHRQEFDEGTGDLSYNQAGVRHFGVTVRIESDSQEPGDESVGALASLLRTRLRRPTVLASLSAANIALVAIEQTIVADRRDRDGRMLSVSLTDITFAAAENDVYAVTADPDGDYVLAVQGAGQPEIEQAELDVDAS